MKNNKFSVNKDAVSNKCIYIIIAINAMFFIMKTPQITTQFALKSDVLEDMKIWNFISYMFIHADFFHIAFNMWSLNLFGKVIIPELKVNKFLNLYFISGIFSALFWLFLSASLGSSIIGASGAVSGVMIAAAMINPDMRLVLLFFPKPIKLKTVMIVIAIFEIFSEFIHTDNVAHSAHLGGFLAGYLYIKLVYKDILWDPLDFIFKGKKKNHKKTIIPKGWSMKTYTQSDNVSQEELDILLDKISATGINSLTDTEMKRLEMAREQMKS